MTWIRQARLALGISQAQMRGLLGITSRQNYCRLETGQREPTLQHRQAIEVLRFIHRLGLLQDLLDELEP